MKVYERTENGTVTTVGQKTGLAEINAAMMGAGRRAVRTMSSITRTDYAIEYTDGRSVRLVLVDAPVKEMPAAEELTEHCTPMAGGKVHTLQRGNLHDGTEAPPFPLCRSGASTNQGTRYRKVDAALTCSTCLEYARRRAIRRAEATA